MKYPSCDFPFNFPKLVSVHSEHISGSVCYSTAYKIQKLMQTFLSRYFKPNLKQPIAGENLGDDVVAHVYVYSGERIVHDVNVCLPVMRQIGQHSATEKNDIYI